MSYDLPQDRIYEACLFVGKGGSRTAPTVQDRLVDDSILLGRRTVDQLIGSNADNIEQPGLNPFDGPAGERRDYRVDSFAISQRSENKVGRPLPLVGFMQNPVQ